MGNVLCAYSSLMVGGFFSGVMFLEIIFQYFKLKYGFQPVLGAWQLDKLNLIFKREEMKISATEIILPSYLEIKWETVGWTLIQSEIRENI